MPSNLYFKCHAINNAIETITTEITSFKNKLQSLSKLETDKKGNRNQLLKNSAGSEGEAQKI